MPASNHLPAGPPATPGEPPPDSDDRVGWARQTLVALRSLPVAQREVIRLAYFERLSQDDIAARLGMPLTSVKVAAATALQRIADLIEGTRASK
jgi:RNA polymerase sigma-70 factor (ECF subfamily)